MAKKLYHLPLQKVEKYLTQHQSDLRSSMKKSKKLELHKRFGKAFYLVEVERFIRFLKIDHELDHALKVVSYFESKNFLDELTELMRLKSFCEAKREHLYVVLYHLYRDDQKLFSLFLGQCFMHFHTTITNSLKR